MRNRQVSSAISLQSNYLLEFLFTRHKLNWKLIWCCLPCWERRTIFSASITFLFCIIFGDLKNRWQSIPITHLFWTQTGLFFFSDWPHIYTLHTFEICTFRQKDIFHHTWKHICLLKYTKIRIIGPRWLGIHQVWIFICVWYWWLKGSGYSHSYRDRTLPGLNISGKSCSQ